MTQIRWIIDETLQSGTLLTEWQARAVTLRHQLGFTEKVTAAIVPGWNLQQVKDLEAKGVELLAHAANTDPSTVITYLAKKGARALGN